MADPDPENGLAVAGHRLHLSSEELRMMLELNVFTPGSTLRKWDGKEFRVIAGAKYQELAA